MNKHWKRQLERINQLQVAYQRAMLTTERVITVTRQVERRREQLREQLAGLEYRFDQLYAKLEAEKVRLTRG